MRQQISIAWAGQKIGQEIKPTSYSGDLWPNLGMQWNHRDVIIPYVSHCLNLGNEAGKARVMQGWIWIKEDIDTCLNGKLRPVTCDIVSIFTDVIISEYNSWPNAWCTKYSWTKCCRLKSHGRKKCWPFLPNHIKMPIIINWLSYAKSNSDKVLSHCMVFCSDSVMNAIQHQ